MAYLLRCLLAMMLFSHSNISFAQNAHLKPQTGPVPSWVQAFDYDTTQHPAGKAITGGQYLELLEEQYNLEKEAIYYKVVRHITSESGVQNSSQISVGYDPSYQRLTFHSIRVLRQGKVIDQLNLSKMKVVQNETALERFIYSGIYTAYLALEDIRSGDKIEYSYTLSGMNPVLAHQFGDLLDLSSYNPISHLFISITTAPGQHLYLRYFNKASKATAISRNDQTVYEWKLSGVPPYIPETNEPSWYYGAPYVQVSTYASWKDVAAWAVNDIEIAAMKHNPLIAKTVAAWNEEAGSDDLRYIRLATRFVQDKIRYMGIEMGAYSHLPHQPGKVMEQRYGDCKDKSLLLCKLLRLRHINAHVAFVNSYNGKNLPEYLPSVNIFDHAIVTFSNKGKTCWIDPTISYQRGKIKDIATPDYGYALVVRENEDTLTRMTVNPQGHMEILERFTLPKDNQSECLLDVITTYTGGSADDIRQQFNINSFTDMQKSYLNYYNQLYNHTSIADSLKFRDDPEENQVTTIEKYRIRDPWEIVDSIQKSRRFTVFAKALQDRLPQTVAEDRNTPIALFSPVNMDYRIQLVPPEYWNIKYSTEIINQGAYSYVFTQSQSEDTINLDYTYQASQNYIPAGDARMLNEDLSKIKSGLSYMLTQNSALEQSRGKVSWLSIIISLISLAFFSFLAVRVYRYSPPVVENRTFIAPPIGGWLIVVSIGLCIAPLRILFTILSNGYLKQSSWMALQSLHQPGVLFIFGIEIAFTIFLLICYLLLLFLFFNRRDILPKTIIFIYVFNIVFSLLDNLAANAYFSASDSSTSFSFLGLIINAAIWIPYFLYSRRVKETFVFPFRGKKNTITGPGPDIDNSAAGEALSLTPGEEDSPAANTQILPGPE